MTTDPRPGGPLGGPAGSGQKRNPELDRVLAEELAGWPVGSATAAVVGPDGLLASDGDLDQRYPWASVTKLVSALTVLVAATRGAVDLDEPAGPPGATVRHLLSHSSGLVMDSDRTLAAPGRRRIYSNRGIEVAVGHLETRTGRAFVTLANDLVLRPLAMTGTTVEGSPAHGAVGPTSDLVALAAELLRPAVLPDGVVAAATEVALPGLSGVLPGFGRQDPNPWGLGFEVRDAKSPHWTSPHCSPTTFGHFGQSGSFLWVDPVAEVACVSLADTPFGPWAAEHWPVLSTRVLEAVGT